MNGMFRYDNIVMRILLKLSDAVILGVLWLVCSIPVVTVGAASTAFYYAYNKSVRQGMGYAWREFFGSFKSNFKQSTKIWLTVLGLFALLLVDCYILFACMETIPVARILLGIMIVMFAALNMWSLFVFPYIARFENGTKEAIKNAAIMMLANIFWAILLMVLYAAAVVMSLWLPVAGIFAPTAYMFFANRILEPVFQRYMAPEDLKRETENQRIEQNSNG